MLQDIDDKSVVTSVSSKSARSGMISINYADGTGKKVKFLVDNELSLY